MSYEIVVSRGGKVVTSEPPTRARLATIKHRANKLAVDHSPCSVVVRDTVSGQTVHRVAGATPEIGPRCPKCDTLMKYHPAINCPRRK